MIGKPIIVEVQLLLYSADEADKDKIAIMIKN